MKTKRIAAAIASMAMVASMATIVPFNASAVDYVLTTAKYNSGAEGASDESVSKNTTSINKYLIMDIDANVPKASFSFEVTPFDTTKDPGAVIVAAGNTAGAIDVYNGIVGSGDNIVTYKVGDASTNTITYSPDDTNPLVIEQESNKAGEIAWFDTSVLGDEKCSTKSISLDFSKLSFPGPGIYRYLVTEKGGTENMAITDDIGATSEAKKIRTLDIVVEDYNAFYSSIPAEDQSKYTSPKPALNELFIKDYTLYSGTYSSAPTNDPNAVITKSKSFTNKYTSYDLTIGKNVAGNQASKDKYFAVTVKIEGAVPNTVYDVSYIDDGKDLTADGNADKTISANPNTFTTCIPSGVTQPDKLTATLNATTNKGEVEQTFYVKHGQTIVIRGLAATTKYTVSEAPENYTPSVTPVLTASGEALGATSSEINEAHDSVIVSSIAGDNSIIFTNTLTGLIPTGILLSVAGPAIIGIIALLGIGAILFKSSRRKAEEE